LGDVDWRSVAFVYDSVSTSDHISLQPLQLSACLPVEENYFTPLPSFHDFFLNVHGDV
jgi:hypothetical protein